MKLSIVLILIVALTLSVSANEAFDKTGCYQPMQTGVCLAAIPAYYYNPNIKGCEMFIYGGCGGSGNRFFTKEECERVCKD